MPRFRRKGSSGDRLEAPVSGASQQGAGPIARPPLDATADDIPTDQKHLGRSVKVRPDQASDRRHPYYGQQSVSRQSLAEMRDMLLKQADQAANSQGSRPLRQRSVDKTNPEAAYIRFQDKLRGITATENGINEVVALLGESSGVLCKRPNGLKALKWLGSEFAQNLLTRIHHDDKKNPKTEAEVTALFKAAALRLRNRTQLTSEGLDHLIAGFESVLKGPGDQGQAGMTTARAASPSPALVGDEKPLHKPEAVNTKAPGAQAHRTPLTANHETPESQVSPAGSKPEAESRTRQASEDAGADRPRKVESRKRPDDEADRRTLEEQLDTARKEHREALLKQEELQRQLDASRTRTEAPGQAAQPAQQTADQAAMSRQIAALKEQVTRLEAQLDEITRLLRDRQAGATQEQPVAEPPRESGPGTSARADVRPAPIETKSRPVLESDGEAVKPPERELRPESNVFPTVEQPPLETVPGTNSEAPQPLAPPTLATGASAEVEAEALTGDPNASLANDRTAREIQRAEMAAQEQVDRDANPNITNNPQLFQNEVLGPNPDALDNVAPFLDEEAMAIARLNDAAPLVEPIQANENDNAEQVVDAAPGPTDRDIAATQFVVSPTAATLDLDEVPGQAVSEKLAPIDPGSMTAIVAGQTNLEQPQPSALITLPTEVSAEIDEAALANAVREQLGEMEKELAFEEEELALDMEALALDGDGQAPEDEEALTGDPNASLANDRTARENQRAEMAAQEQVDRDANPNITNNPQLLQNEARGPNPDALDNVEPLPDEEAMAIARLNDAAALVEPIQANENDNLEQVVDAAPGPAQRDIESAQFVVSQAAATLDLDELPGQAVSKKLEPVDPGPMTANLMGHANLEQPQPSAPTITPTAEVSAEIEEAALASTMRAQPQEQEDAEPTEAELLAQAHELALLQRNPNPVMEQILAYLEQSQVNPANITPPSPPDPGDARPAGIHQEQAPAMSGENADPVNANAPVKREVDVNSTSLDQARPDPTVEIEPHPASPRDDLVEPIRNSSEDSQAGDITQNGIPTAHGEGEASNHSNGGNGQPVPIPGPAKRGEVEHQRPDEPVTAARTTRAPEGESETREQIEFWNLVKGSDLTQALRSAESFIRDLDKRGYRPRALGEGLSEWSGKERVRRRTRRDYFNTPQGETFDNKLREFERDVIHQTHRRAFSVVPQDKRLNFCSALLELSRAGPKEAGYDSAAYLASEMLTALEKYAKGGGTAWAPVLENARNPVQDTKSSPPQVDLDDVLPTEISLQRDAEERGRVFASGVNQCPRFDSPEDAVEWMTRSIGALVDFQSGRDLGLERRVFSQLRELKATKEHHEAARTRLEGLHQLVRTFLAPAIVRDIEPRLIRPFAEAVAEIGARSRSGIAVNDKASRLMDAITDALGAAVHGDDDPDERVTSAYAAALERAKPSEETESIPSRQGDPRHEAMAIADQIHGIVDSTDKTDTAKRANLIWSALQELPSDHGDPAAPDPVPHNPYLMGAVIERLAPLVTLEIAQSLALWTGTLSQGQIEAGIQRRVSDLIGMQAQGDRRSPFRALAQQAMKAGQPDPHTAGSTTLDATAPPGSGSLDPLDVGIRGARELGLHLSTADVDSEALHASLRLIIEHPERERVLEGLAGSVNGAALLNFTKATLQFLDANAYLDTQVLQSFDAVFESVERRLGQTLETGFNFGSGAGSGADQVKTQIREWRESVGIEAADESPDDDEQDEEAAIDLNPSNRASTRWFAPGDDPLTFDPYADDEASSTPDAESAAVRTPPDPQPRPARATRVDAGFTFDEDLGAVLDRFEQAATQGRGTGAAASTEPTEDPHAQEADAIAQTSAAGAAKRPAQRALSPAEELLGEIASAEPGSYGGLLARVGEFIASNADQLSPRDVDGMARALASRFPDKPDCIHVDLPRVILATTPDQASAVGNPSQTPGQATTADVCRRAAAWALRLMKFHGAALTPKLQKRFLDFAFANQPRSDHFVQRVGYQVEMLGMASAADLSPGTTIGYEHRIKAIRDLVKGKATTNTTTGRLEKTLLVPRADQSINRGLDPTFRNEGLLRLINAPRALPTSGGQKRMGDSKSR